MILIKGCHIFVPTGFRYFVMFFSFFYSFKKTFGFHHQVLKSFFVVGFFLVLFSYSFFVKGITGLTVAIGSVLTLAILMKVTAHVKWAEVFAGQWSLMKSPAMVASSPAMPADEPPPL